MAAKLLSFYVLAVAGLGVVRAGTSANWRLIRPVRRFVDGVREIVPLILDQRQNNPNGTQPEPLFKQFGPDLDKGATNLTIKQDGTSAKLENWITLFVIC
jgi:hypothetical protein